MNAVLPAETPAETPAEAEVLVVGAGVIGLGVAWELLRRGRAVTVLERDRPGAGASGVSAGMLAPTSEADLADPALIELGLDSLDRYPRFVAELEAATGISCRYREEGTLWVALDRDDEAEIEHLRGMQVAKGLAARWLGHAEVLAREPHLSGRVVSGLLIERDRQVDPRSLVRCLEAAVRARGGTIATGWRVAEIEAGVGRLACVHGLGPGGEFTLGASAVVLAAGAWSTLEVASPLAWLGVRPVKGQLLRLTGPPLVDHVVRTPAVYLVPRPDGELVVGASMEEQGFDPLPTAGAVLDLLREAWRLLPGVYDLAVAELSVGFRPAVRDHRPVIGATAVPGLYVATGHFRNGVLLAPATAHYLAELISTGRLPAALLPFAPGRLERSGAPAAGAVAVEGLVA